MGAKLSAMLAGKSYIVAGISRLGLRLIRMLCGQNAHVICVQLGDDDRKLVAQLPDTVAAIQAGDRDLVELFRQISEPGLCCLLAVSDNDLDNIRCCVAAREVTPDVPVVLRAFDPSLADQLEQGLNVRRAYSVSALSAPAFVAATFGVEVMETLRLGDSEVLICRFGIDEQSAIVGLVPSEVLRRFGCVVLAINSKITAENKDQPNGVPIKVGDEVVLGGLFSAIYEAAIRTQAASLSTKRVVTGQRRRSRASRDAGVTYLPIVAIALTLLIFVSVIVFKIYLHLSLIDAVYFVITTATTTGYGDITLKDSPWWLKLYGNAVMLSGGALLGILFSYVAARATAERLGDMMGRRAERMRGHIVVVGMGNVGYRVVNQFLEYRLPVVAVELNSNARFAEALGRRIPVIFGDIRLVENLQRASLETASAIVSCTNDDMANIQACLHARRLNPTIRTVARVFDDTLAERLTKAFQIDQALSPSQLAAGAFFGAASDDRAVRHINIGSHGTACFRLTAGREISSDDLTEWNYAGLSVIAYKKREGEACPVGHELTPFEAGDELILFGPETEIRKRAH